MPASATPDPQPPVKRPGTIVRVSYGATVNIGDYETIRFDYTADVGPGEKWQDVFERLRTLTEKHKARIKDQGY